MWERLKNHAINKDFWSEEILFTSKDDNITKSHIKYLESRLIEITKQAERYILDNRNSPSLSAIPLLERKEKEECILNIKLLTKILGHNFFKNQIHCKQLNIKQSTTIKTLENKEVVIPENGLELNLNVKKIIAQTIRTDEDFFC